MRESKGKKVGPGGEKCQSHVNARDPLEIPGGPFCILAVLRWGPM